MEHLAHQCWHFRNCNATTHCTQQCPIFILLNKDWITIFVFCFVELHMIELQHTTQFLLVLSSCMHFTIEVINPFNIEWLLIHLEVHVRLHVSLDCTTVQPIHAEGEMITIQQLL